MRTEDMSVTTIYLQNKMLKEIEKRAKENDMNRSQYMRKLIDAGLEFDRDGTITRNVVLEETVRKFKNVMPSQDDADTPAITPEDLEARIQEQLGKVLQAYRDKHVNFGEASIDACYDALCDKLYDRYGIEKKDSRNIIPRFKFGDMWESYIKDLGD